MKLKPVVCACGKPAGHLLMVSSYIRPSPILSRDWCGDLKCGLRLVRSLATELPE